MGQYLYISSGKIAAFDPGKSRSLRPSGTLGVGLPILSVQLQMAGDAERGAEFRRLDELRKKIGPTALEFADPRLAPTDWCRFEMQMSWGTLHADAEPPGAERVVAITGPAPWPQPVGSTELVLLGSTCHLRDRVGSAGRMGSTSDTLYTLASSRNLIAAPPTRGTVGESEWEWNMSEVAGSLTRIIDNHRPRWQQARLEGLAQVIHTCREGYVTNLVVATPLYVRRLPSRTPAAVEPGRRPWLRALLGARRSTPDQRRLSQRRPIWRRTVHLPGAPGNDRGLTLVSEPLPSAAWPFKRLHGWRASAGVARRRCTGSAGRRTAQL